MEALCYRTPPDGNPKKLRFLKTQTARNKNSGLFQTKTETQFFDPWGNPYYVLLNYDRDHQLKMPKEFGGQIHQKTKVLIWSTGPDGKQGTPETNEDNVHSW